MQQLPTLPVITYNLKERGRVHRGQPRNFDIKAICDAVNGPVCQERVKTRAMLGYFGHKMRILAGLEPQESVVIGGKYNEVEPAIVTTYLEAFPDGTIKHQTEFLDTEPGRKAARMYQSRVGGFSSAIDEKRPEFYGFDWVLDPNYSTNRPYALDSVGLTFDAVVAEAIEEEEAGWMAQIKQRDDMINALQAALDSAQADNEQYASMLASGNYTSGAALDSAAHDGGPLILPVDGAERLRSGIHAFRATASLPQFIEKDGGSKAADTEYNQILGMVNRV